MKDVSLLKVEMMGAAKRLRPDESLVKSEIVASKDDFPNRHHSESGASSNRTAVKRKDCKPPMSIFETLSEELDLPLNETSDPPFKKAKIDSSSSPSTSESSPTESFFTARSNGATSEASEKKENVEVSESSNKSSISDAVCTEKAASEAETKETQPSEKLAKLQNEENQSKEATAESGEQSDSKVNDVKCEEKANEKIATNSTQETAIDDKDSNEPVDEERSEDTEEKRMDLVSVITTSSEKSKDGNTENQSKLSKPMTELKESVDEISPSRDDEASEEATSTQAESSEVSLANTENETVDHTRSDVDKQIENTKVTEISKVSSSFSVESEPIVQINSAKETEEQVTKEGETENEAYQKLPQIQQSSQVVPEILDREQLGKEVAEMTDSSSVVFLSTENSSVSSEVSNANISNLHTELRLGSIRSVPSAATLGSSITSHSHYGFSEEPIDPERRKQIEKVVDFVATDFLNTSAYQYLNARLNSESSELMDNFVTANGLREDYIEEIGFVDYASSVGKSTLPLVSDETLKELMESEGDLSASNPFAVWAPEEINSEPPTPVQDVSNCLNSNNLPQTVSSSDVPNAVINVPAKSNLHLRQPVPCCAMVPSTQVPAPVIDFSNSVTNSETIVSALPELFSRPQVPNAMVMELETSAAAIKTEPITFSSQENPQCAYSGFVNVSSQVNDCTSMSVSVQSDVSESSASSVPDEGRDLTSLSQQCTEVIKFSMRQYRQSWLRKGASGCQRIECDQADVNTRWGSLLSILEQKLNVQMADFGCQMSSSQSSSMDAPPNRSTNEIPILPGSTFPSSEDLYNPVSAERVLITNPNKNTSCRGNQTMCNQPLLNQQSRPQQSESDSRSFTTSNSSLSATPNCESSRLACDTAIPPNQQQPMIDHPSGQILTGQDGSCNSPSNNKQFALVHVVKSNTSLGAGASLNLHRASPGATVNILKRGRGRPPRSNVEAGTPEVKKLPTLGVRPKAAAGASNVQLSNIQPNYNLPLSSSNRSPYLVVPLQTVTSSSAPAENMQPMYQVVMASNSSTSYDRNVNSPSHSNTNSQRLPDNIINKSAPSARSPRHPEPINSMTRKVLVQHLPHSDSTTNSMHKQKPTNQSQVIDLVSDDDDDESDVSFNSSSFSAPNRFLPQNNSHLLLNSNSNYRNTLEKQKQQRRKRSKFNRADFLLPVTKEIEKMSNSVEAASHDLPPKLYLSANPTENNNNSNNRGITLIWKMFVPKQTNCKILKYELMANTGGGNNTNCGNSGWVLVDSIDPLVLPMQCSLTNLNPGVIHFAIRGIDVFKRAGDYSNVVSVSIPKQVSQTSK